MTFRALLLLAAGLAPFSVAANEEPLPVDQAFKYEATADAEAIEIQWEVAEGYYLYKKRLGFESATDGVQLGKPEIPMGHVKEDEFFGKSQIFRDRELLVRIPYQGRSDTSVLRLELKSQGCADFGLCYPPQRWQTDIKLPGGNVAAAPTRNLLAELAASPDYGGAQDFLPFDEAFRFTAEVRDAYTLRAAWDIADGYYLYKDKIKFSASGNMAQTGAPRLPAGKKKYDEFFGDVEVYYGRVEIDVPLSRGGPQAGDLELSAASQGCAEDGICYPPQTQDTFLILPAVDAAPPRGFVPADTTPLSEQDQLASRILGGNLLLAMGAMLLAGIGLAFTPCVLPMVPILSSIIAGQEGVTRGQGFKLSIIYVLPMVLTYTVAGIIAAIFGGNLTAMFQQPGVIIAFSLVFVVLALSMFGVYQLQIPSALQNRLNQISNQQQGGTYSGVAIMGMLSALIVGPCVAAPLAGALIVIGQHGDVVRGGLALFALSLGMGLPLIAFGAGAGHLVPRAGAWMNTIKVLFGFMLIGVAIWMLSRILPGQATQALWALLALAVAGFLLLDRAVRSGGPASLGARVTAVLLAGYGGVLALSAAAGGADPLAPLRGTAFGKQELHLEFTTIKTVADLEREVAAASAAGRPAMLDFYADWCVSCKEMEKYTFTDPAVHEALADTLLLKADVTANDDADQALLRYFNIIGPPTIAFFNRDGEEPAGTRVVGFLKPAEFSTHVRAVLTDASQTVADGS